MLIATIILKYNPTKYRTLKYGTNEQVTNFKFFPDLG